jgi:3-hydroxymyristoyl/3-hydroxydecanoyl-(acyl carrier protein) dehydratase
MAFEWRFTIPADHPSLAGHFPGNPVVPGTVILDEIVHAFGQWQPDQCVTGLSLVKFLAPLKPQCLCIVRFAEADQGSHRFECLGAEGEVLVQGRFSTVTATP